ncbi:MAG: HEPN domain-containing protein [Bacilli bacterium]|nr:HEPN domain-containing protein [Bacilli bacterium]
MKYRYEGILCGADDGILNFKYEDVSFKKEVLDIVEFKTKYGNFFLDNFYGGMYKYNSDDKYEIIKIVIEKSKPDFNDKNLELDFEIEQYMHKQIDFVVSAINLVTDAFLYVLAPVIYVTNTNDGNSQTCIFPYETPNSSFLGSSQTFREKNFFIKYDVIYLVENLKFVKENNILDIVKYYYNNHKSIHNRPIQFTTLMTCLEIMLVEGKGELSDKISRNVAVIFSRNKEEGNEIYRKLKKLYNIRSKIVHEGKFDTSKYYKKYNKDAYYELELIVLNVIQIFIKHKFIKKDLIEELQGTGYGEFYQKYKN